MTGLLKERKQAAAMWKNPLIHRVVLGIAAGAVMLALALTGLLWWLAPWRWLKIIMCFLAVTFAARAALGLLSSILPLVFPSQFYKQIAGFAAIWITVAVYFLPNRTFRFLTAGAFALLFMIPAMIGVAWRVMMEWRLPREAFKDYQHGKAGDRGRYGLIVSQPGSAALFARRLGKMFASAIVFSRGQKQFFTFMNLESLRRFPEGFQRSVERSVPAVLVVRQAFGPPNQRFNDTVQDLFNISSGLIFDVLLIRQMGDLNAVKEYRGVNTFPLLVSSEQHDVKEIIPAMVDKLVSNGIPLGESDNKLPAELRNMMDIVASQGFPPLANCYLRFRLSQSNVERFLCLLDCFEVMIKLSVFHSLAVKWSQDSGSASAEVATQLERPALGTWCEILSKLAADPGQDELRQRLSTFWNQRLAGRPRQLITDAKGSGLAYPGDMPRSHLGWLQWLAWLRNKTRGHGAVEENQVAPVWHGLHETFLEMALALRPLIADSAFATRAEDGSITRSAGWSRKIRAAMDTRTKPALPTEPVFMLRNTGAAAQELRLHPFVIKSGDNFVIWNSTTDTFIEYIDYGTGQILQFKSRNTNPRELWAGGQAAA